MTVTRKPLATVGILSIGDMGSGIAKLLTGNGYRVVTNITGRSQATHARAESASVDLISTDEELATTCDYILSIVPPRDALATASRIAKVGSNASFSKRSRPLYYLDLNAISPRSAREVAELFTSAQESIRFLDGGIIGGPPKPKDASETPNTPEAWQRPSIPTSGPHPIEKAEPSGHHLANLLDMQHISNEIGPASGLKMCFASLTKGFTALAIQSFTTAHRLGVLNHLQEYVGDYYPESLKTATKGVIGMPPKAYRWVREMEEIGDTFAEDGGFGPNEAIFKGISGTYDLVAHGTELGKETTEQRTRGKDANDVAAIMSEGINRRKEKTD